MAFNDERGNKMKAGTSQVKGAHPIPILYLADNLIAETGCGLCYELFHYRNTFYQENSVLLQIKQIISQYW